MVVNAISKEPTATLPQFYIKNESFAYLEERAECRWSENIFVMGKGSEQCGAVPRADDKLFEIRRYSKSFKVEILVILS